MTNKEIEIQIALGTLPIDNKLKLAVNPDTPKEVLKKLSKDKDSSVRYYVADNPNTPKEALKKLSIDKDWYVRCRAIRTLKEKVK